MRADQARKGPRALRNLRGRQSVNGRRRHRSSGYGVGYAPAHHGELLQGVFEDCENGTARLRRGLVTLPLPQRGTRATFYPSEEHWGVVGTPELIKVRRAAVLALREFSTHPSPAKGGQIEITTDVPLGIGMGSSTSDVTATIRAVADYHGVALSPEEVGRLAVLAECASDSIMIDDRVVLFAHRDGVVIEELGERLPPMIVLGCDTDPGRGVDTLALRPAEYGPREVAEFAELRAAVRSAVATGDTALLGEVATASARINERFLPKPGFEALLGLCAQHGGCGVQVAHSGTVAGLIFDARRPGVRLDVRRCAERLGELGLPITMTIGVEAETPKAEPPKTEPAKTEAFETETPETENTEDDEQTMVIA